MKITAKGITREFESGVSYHVLAEGFQDLYEDDILLVVNDNKLLELHKHCNADATLQFITARERIGRMTYARSCLFMMLKAFYEICSGVKGFEVIVDYTIGGGYYGYLKGDIQVTSELLESVMRVMGQYQSERIPIMKRSVSTQEAIELFHRHGMYDKERLFHYRRTSRVNIYSIGRFEDYFYGYMVKDTSYLKYFQLVPYQEGFVLMLPEEKNPKQVPTFRPLDRLYQVQNGSSKWAEQLGVSNVGLLNDRIAEGRTEELILMQEAIFEKNIGNIANRILQEKKRIVMIAGPSSSGKTTFSHRLSIQLKALGLKPYPIAVDNYFRSRKLAPRDQDGNYDFESIRCLDVEQLNEDMTRLLAGERVELPRFNFFTGEREYKGDYLSLGDQDILILEGIHCLNEEMSYALPKEKKFKIYISALTQINIDEHNRIPTTDLRLIRRMVRDSRTRGYSAEETIRMWRNVRRGEDENIFPYQESADVMVNSAMIYELPVLKIYAEPLLFRISQDSPVYNEAKRLLKFLDYFLAITPEPIPKTSIVREFIGGSCLDVG